MIKSIFILISLIIAVSASDYGHHGSGYHYSTTIYHPASYYHAPSYGGYHAPSYGHYDPGSYKVDNHAYGKGYKSGYSTVYNIRHYPKYHHYEPSYHHYQPHHYEHQPSYHHGGHHYQPHSYGYEPYKKK